MLPNELSGWKQAGQKLTNHAKNSLLKAAQIASKFEYGEILNIHLLYAIYLEKGSIGGNIIADLGLHGKKINAVLKEHSPHATAPKNVMPSSELKKIFIKAYAIAKDFKYSYVGTEHLAYALLDSPNILIQKLIPHSVQKTNDGKTTSKKVSQSIKSIFYPEALPNLSRILNLPEIIGQKDKSNYSPTPYVDKFCVNINEEVKKEQETIVGREKEIERIINILGRKNKNNPLLIGDPGVGKTALVYKLAQLIQEGEVPKSIHEKRIMSLDIAQLVAGTSFRGEFELRLKEIIKEVSTNKNILLFIDEIHNIIGAGNAAGSLDVANMVKPVLGRGEMQVIGATTLAEYKKYIEKDTALERRFQPVHVEEPNIAETKRILSGIKANYESFHNVTISPEAISLAVELSSRYIQNRFFPDKAIDTLDEAASYVRSKHNVSDFNKQIKKIEEEKRRIFHEKEIAVTEENFEKAIQLRSQEQELDMIIKNFREKQTEIEKESKIAIGADDILETISRISGVPMEKLSQERSQKVKNARTVIESKIIGQEEAVEKLCNTLLRSQAGISSPDRPLGSFLFLGPTGVGKTLTAKVLAREFFGSEKSLIRIDMSELMEHHSLASLIGSPAGYVGYGEGGNLTEKVRRNPYSIVLFDEIEKAHPNVLNILLQMLEDGMLTDAQGLQVSFKNTIIILTSNIGTDEFTIASRMGFASEKDQKEISREFQAIEERALSELKRRIKPELLNRLDYILVFKPLGKKELYKITRLELEKLRKRTSELGIRLSYGKTVIQHIAERSVSQSEGARLIRRNIQELIEDKIAEMIIYGKVKKNCIKIKAIKEKIVLT